MAAFINTNIASLNAQRNLNTSQSALQTSLQRLSSGLRINSAKDDAAGLAITEGMTSQIRGMNQAARNANDGISLAQTAEGTLAEIGNNLQRIRELAVQSRNATNNDTNRQALQSEVGQLKSEIDRVAKQTTFNGNNLLDGTFSNMAFQVGAEQGQTISVNSIVNAQISALGSWTSVDTAHAPVSGAAPTGGASAGSPAVATDSVASGAFTAAAATTAGKVFTLTIDGQTAFTKTSDGGGGAGDAVTAGELDTAVSAFVTASNGAYSIKSGTVAGGDLVLSKADGTTMAIALTSDFDTTAGSFAGAGFVGNQTGGTPAVPSTPATFGAITAGQLKINGTDITVGSAADAATRLSDLVTAINNKSDTTGVKAEISGSALKLTSVSGSGDINIQGSATASSILQQTGLTKQDNLHTTGSAQTGFANLDVSTADGADNAIKAMDAALKAVNAARANLGAVQNRFSSVIANLQTTSENLSASRSRIQDADFAAETANLTRGQILQQAGTAMLAQANSLPNGVLALLRG